MQEHRKQASKESAKEEDNWRCTSTHFEGILNFKRQSINVISKRMYLHLCFKDCKTDLEHFSHLSNMEAFNCNECKVGSF
jgi:hypothetical protein